MTTKSKGNRYPTHTKQSTNNVNLNGDNVKHLVQKEGRSARNLVQWSVPVDDNEYKPQYSRRTSRFRKKSTEKQNDLTTNAGSERLAKLKTAGNKTKTDLRARYWAFLFDNLQRVVDAIYQTCEEYESIVECEEAIVVLFNCKKDFESLIERIRVQNLFESTDVANRPTSLAWEVRKQISSGKTLSSPNNPPERSSSRVNGKLSFNTSGTSVPCQPSATNHTQSADRIATTFSWADRVKGLNTIANLSIPPVLDTETKSKEISKAPLVTEDSEEILKNGDQDTDGEWKTVGRDKTLTNKSQKILKHKLPENNCAPLSQHVDTDNAKSIAEDVDSGFPAFVARLESEEQLASELDTICNEALETAFEEEKNLTEQIELQEIVDISMDTSQDQSDDNEDTETEQLADHETNDQKVGRMKELECSSDWADMVELEEMEGREPGRGIKIHQRLSSPSRTLSLCERKRRYEEKQAKAEELRGQLNEERQRKIQMFMERRDEVRQWKDELLRCRKDACEEKMHRAEIRRAVSLKAIVEKAHEEDAKVSEIAFINMMEAQMKRHDVMSKLELQEAKMHEIEEERQRKCEEKKEKEEAVQERKKALEEERSSKLELMLDKRKDHEQKVSQLMKEKHLLRESNAKSRDKLKEEKLLTLSTDYQHKVGDLQIKIKQKSEESSQRYEAFLTERRERALKPGVKRALSPVEWETFKTDVMKKCCLCSASLKDAAQLQEHLITPDHQKAIQSKIRSDSKKWLSCEEIAKMNCKHILDVAPVDNLSLPDKYVMSKERNLLLKKRLKKLRARMTSKSTAYENKMSSSINSNYENKPKMLKSLREINRQLNNQFSASKIQPLERCLADMGRLLEKGKLEAQNCFLAAAGFSSLCRLLLLAAEPSDGQSGQTYSKFSSQITKVLIVACANNRASCLHMLYSNKVSTLVNVLVIQLQSDVRVVDAKLLTPLLDLISVIFHGLSFTAVLEQDSCVRDDPLIPRTNDLLSYLVCTGCVDYVVEFLTSCQTPVDPELADFLQAGLNLLASAVALLLDCSPGTFDIRKDEQNMLLNTLVVTECCSSGVVSLLYGLLFQSSNAIPEYTVVIATHCVNMLNNVAMVDVAGFQKMLEAEATGLELRHIGSFLMTYSSKPETSNDQLLQGVVCLLGFFAVLNTAHQNLLQSGKSPTVLQQLCSLPFNYFSSPKLKMVLFPTLIACCFHVDANKRILEQEMSCQLLSSFIQEHMSGDRAINAAKSGRNTQNGGPNTLLENRFPLSKWKEAIEFFQN